MSKTNISISVSLILLLLLGSCVENPMIDYVRKENPPLIDLLREFKDEKEKYRSLEYLLNHSEPSEIKSYHRDSVKMNIDLACAKWNDVRWADDYDKSVFYEYILPMQVTSEPLEYYWRSSIPTLISIDARTDDMIGLSKQINKQIVINTSRESWGVPLLGYTKTMQGSYGKCDDRSVLAVMAMRAYGIPAAYEAIPHWGSSNNGHSICTVIGPDDSVKVFQNPLDEEDVFMFHKTPKIYRRTFSKQTETPIYRYRNKETIPSLFSNFRLKDVTSHHSIGSQDVELRLDVVLDSRIVYLSVFSTDEWFPISYTERKRSQAAFKDIGNGANQYGDNSTKGDDIGTGILYLPCYYVDSKVVPCAHPVIVSVTGTRNIKCNPHATEKVVLYRKFPQFQRMKDVADEMIDGVVEGANKADYSDAELLYSISETPKSRLQKINIEGEYRYIRYRKPQGTFSIGELRVYDKANSAHTGKLHTMESLKGEKEVNNVIDGEPLSFYSLKGGIDVWVGIDLGRIRDIGFIEFAPRNDDNSISIGDSYELFYWNNEWISLGKKVATDYVLEYNNSPKGALLWLRNQTKGREERPFTYEDGKQIWW